MRTLKKFAATSSPATTNIAIGDEPLTNFSVHPAVKPAADFECYAVHKWGWRSNTVALILAPPPWREFADDNQNVSITANIGGAPQKSRDVLSNLVLQQQSWSVTGIHMNVLEVSAFIMCESTKPTMLWVQLQLDYLEARKKLKWSQALRRCWVSVWAVRCPCVNVLLVTSWLFLLFLHTHLCIWFLKITHTHITVEAAFTLFEPFIHNQQATEAVISP